MKMNQNTQHIWFSSDTHFGHNRAFLYEPRGFSNIYEHDKTIINNWNSLVDNNDEVYLLGDIMLGDNEYGLKCLKQLKGKIHIIRGNHCTDARMQLYSQCWNVVEITNTQSIYLDIHIRKLTSIRVFRLCIMLDWILIIVSQYLWKKF